MWRAISRGGSLTRGVVMIIARESQGMTRSVEWVQDREIAKGTRIFEIFVCLGLASIEFGYPGVRIILLLNSNMFIEYVFKTLSLCELDG